MPETLEMAGADNNRHVRRQAARKHSIDGCLLRCNRPLADALDAMTSSRTYRPALSWREACRRVPDDSGTQFAPHVVVAFETAVAEGTLTPLPAGGTIHLKPGRVA